MEYKTSHQMQRYCYVTRDYVFLGVVGLLCDADDVFTVPQYPLMIEEEVPLGVQETSLPIAAVADATETPRGKHRRILSVLEN
jgi:hypothetical protein